MCINTSDIIKMQGYSRTLSPGQISIKKKLPREIIRPSLSNSMSLGQVNSTVVIKKRKSFNNKCTPGTSPNKHSQSPGLKNSKSFCMKLPLLDQSAVLRPHAKSNIQRCIFKNTSPMPNISLPTQSIDLKKKYIKLDSASVTQVGTIEGVPKSNNQDSFIELKKVPNTNGVSFFCVLDGHGPNGHHVSQHLQTHYPQMLQKYISKIDPKLPESSLQNLFEQVIEELEDSLKQSMIDIVYSGSTLLSVLLFENSCICCSIGDSRAILADFETIWGCKALNKEHKPGDSEEKRRIESTGGRVGCMRDSNGRPMGPVRAWGPAPNSPGLAMSRTLGDTFAEHFGVCSQPGKNYSDVKVFNLRNCDKFIIVATDGLWDALSNHRIVEIAKGYWDSCDPTGAAEMLLKQACRTAHKNGGYVDDITIIVIFRY